MKMKFFAPFSLYQKLLAGYLFLLFILIVPCIFSLYSIYKIENTISTYFQKTLEVSSSLEYAKNLVPSLEAEARRLVILHKADSLRQVKQIIRKLDAKISPERFSGMGFLQKNLIEFHNTLKLLEKIALSYQPIVGGQIKKKTTVPSLTDEAREQEVKGLTLHLMEILKRAEAIQKLSLRNKSRETSMVISHVKNGTILLMIFAFVVALFVPWALYIYIRRPIKYLQEGTYAIGGGNFDHKIPVVSRDELGELAKSFNRMASSLKELDTLKSDFIAVASHELKTPLAAMLEATKLLQEPGIGHLNQRQKKLVDVLNTSMERFKSLVDELLDLSKMQAGLVSLDMEKVPLKELFKSLCSHLSTLLVAKDLKIDVEYFDNNIIINVDRKRIERALLNLLDNAIAFSPRGGTIKIKVQRYIEGKRHYVEIAVVDEGPGVSVEEHARVFEKFYQSKAAPRQSGSGLGLTIARQIIQAHGGKIWLESPPPKEVAITRDCGTAVFLRLPL